MDTEARIDALYQKTEAQAQFQSAEVVRWEEQLRVNKEIKNSMADSDKLFEGLTRKLSFFCGIGSCGGVFIGCLASLLLAKLI